jgi:hypothetical protein
VNDAGARSTFRTKTGWGQSGNLITGNKTQRVSMQADFNVGVGAFDFTAQFSLTPPGGGLGDAVVNAEALIHWRVEGQEVTRRVTIGAGTAVTGTGQAVRVEMFDATPPQFTQLHALPGTAHVTEGSAEVIFTIPPVLIPGSAIIFAPQPKVQYLVERSTAAGVTLTTPYTGPSNAATTASSVFERAVQYGVSVQVSAGVRGSSGQPPLLQPYDGPPYVSEFSAENPAPGTGFLFVVDVGESIAINIPEDAGVTQVFVTAVSSGTLKPVGAGMAYAVIRNAIAPQRTWDTQVTTGWVPIPPGAEQIILVVATDATQNLEFSVAFGIDG